MTTDWIDPEVIVERVGSLGRLRLNRPKALNSLTIGMVRALSAALDGLEVDQGIATVLLTGEGDRGLCAGGDIRALYDGPRGRDGPAAQFWREEYRLNAKIAHFPKSLIAIMDGLTMGGGVGVSAHCATRIVTERTRIAMPEVGIGFVPDVGASWLLPRAPGEVGTYLALTGEAIGAEDAIFAGLADLQMRVASVPDLIDDLAHLRAGSADGDIAAVLDCRCLASGPPPLEARRPTIDRAFGHDRVEDILAALEADGSASALDARDVVRAKSPTSLKLALRLLRIGSSAATLEECLEREFAAARVLVQRHDFYEGVRAAIIDKDRNPRWCPATLADVDDDDIEAWIMPTVDRVFPERASVRAKAT